MPDSEPKLLVCLAWDAPHYTRSIARKCGCGKVVQVHATNISAANSSRLKIVCLDCAWKDPEFRKQISDSNGIGVMHEGRPISIALKVREDA
jgi:hypothetical protein